MTNPVPGYKVTTPYGVPGNWAAGYHTGDDYAAPMGAKVVAARSGKVIKTGYNGDYGNQVIIQTGNIRHSYNHLSVISVSAGQQVAEGQQVGKVGKTGRSTGPHLHFEERDEPYAYANHREPKFNNTDGPYVTSNIYSDKLGYGQQDSDTVKELQQRLNRISLEGGRELPITGNYLDMTDQEVRLWQQQVCGDDPDDPRKSFLGPKQLRRMFASPPYTIHDRGLPAIATSDGGSDDGGGNPDVDTPAPPVVVAWFVPPSLAALKSEIDTRWPDRDTSSDGTIGDYAHSTSKSEHNPVGHEFGPEFGTPGAVHAMDITVAGTDSQEILDALLGDHRVWYVIYNGKIWSKTYEWAERPYSGPDSHTKHIHVSLAADNQISAVRNETDESLWFEPNSDIPKLPEALENFIRSNFAPIMIIGTVVVIVLLILASI